MQHRDRDCGETPAQIRLLPVRTVARIGQHLGAVGDGLAQAFAPVAQGELP